jgi:class 3 adenylate cyclase/tetratricopeptide (TPR) repeat protein
LTCAACGAENRADRKFCGECGAPLARSCAACGAANEPTVKFCGECGAALEARPASDVPSAAANAAVATNGPVAERRLVSVLFADLVGFTTLSESRDAEEVRDLLSRYFDTSRQVISRYGGVVEKFIGDAVMAVWGTPTTMEDDAERAVRAALELVDAVTALGEEIGAPSLRARAGILTGEAAVNLGAVGEGMVAGDLVNTASRIQAAAPPGAVFVGEATRRASDAAIVYEDAGTHALKGKAEPVPLWRVLRVATGIRGSGRSSALEPPFLGRDRELRLIKDLFHASGEGRKAQLVTVVGAAGIGKSRLVWEFEKYVDGLVIDTRWHRGRCLAYGEGVTFWALAEMVRTNASILEGEDPATALPKVREAVERAIPDAEERRWVEPRLASLLGLEPGGARDREDLFAAWRRFYERLAEEMPTVMVFEDIHWADPSLLDFVEYLLEWARDHAIFILAVGRPELLEKRPNWGAGARSSTTIHLDPLPGATMGELLDALVPGLPDEVESKVLDRAEGVPLYAVETVRMLLDKGLITQEGEVFRPTGPVEELDVPETLHGLIAARLDGLSAEDRRLVQDASVLGKTFTARALAAVSGEPQEELEPRLAGLVRKQIFTLLVDTLSPERGQYSFLGDLIRWVAYETLSKRERKTRHVAVATYLESAFDEEDVVEVVASHYLQAFEAVRDADDAADIRERARDALTRAGERASSLAASDEALRYFEQAIELTDEALPAAELHERAGRMAWLAGQIGVATSHLEQAIAMFTSIGLTHPAAGVSAALAEVTWQEGHIESAVERMEAAFAVLAQEEQDADLAMLAAQLGRLQYFMGERVEALVHVEFALEIGEGLRLPEVLSQALNTKGLILSSGGRFEEGDVLLRRALEIALEHDLSAAALRAYGNLAAIMSQQDRYVDEMELMSPALELARRVGDRAGELSTLAGPIPDLVYLGRWDEALAIEEEVGSVPGLPEGVLVALVCASPIHVARGDIGAARETLSFLPDGASSLDVQTRSCYLVAASPILRAEGRAAEALAAAEEAYTVRNVAGIRAQQVKEGLAEALEAAFALEDLTKVEQLLGEIEAMRPGELTPYVRSQGARSGARLSVARKEAEGVEAGFAAAADGFRDLSMPFLRSVTLLEHGEWLVDRGRAEEARPLLDEAREVFGSLKAVPWLERLEKAASGIGVEAGA